MLESNSNQTLAADAVLDDRIKQCFFRDYLE